MSLSMSVSNMLRIKELQNKKIEDPWCEQHQMDVQQLIDAVENLIETAKQSAFNPQAQDLLVSGKKEFVEMIMDIGSNYRHVANEI